MRGMITVVAGLALLGLAAPAMGQCKGLKKVKCVKQADCSWIKAHTRKGKKVKGHCRAKPGAKKAVEKVAPAAKPDALKAGKAPAKVAKTPAKVAKKPAKAVKVAKKPAKKKKAVKKKTVKKGG